MINYTRLLFRATRKPATQRLRGKSLAIPLSQSALGSSPQRRHLRLGPLGIGLNLAPFALAAYSLLPTLHSKKASFFRIFFNRATLAVAPGTFCTRGPLRIGGLRLPSGQVLPETGVRSLSRGRVESLAYQSYKSTSCLTKLKKLSVRGSAKNAKDHYNGGKGTGGFLRFV